MVPLKKDLLYLSGGPAIIRKSSGLYIYLPHDEKAEEKSLKLMRLFKNLYLEIKAAHSGTNWEETTKKVSGFDPQCSGQLKIRSQVHTDVLLVKDIYRTFCCPSLVEGVKAAIGLSILTQIEITDLLGLVICYVKYDPVLALEGVHLHTNTVSPL